MADDSVSIRPFLRQQATSIRLESWKQIAAYLKRHETTLRRWEQHEGLPVHRHFHSKLGSIYAYSGELDAWLETRKPDEPSAPGAKARARRSDGVVPFAPPSPSAVLPSWPGVFIHREAELATLTQAWERSITGSAQLVLISGEPGIGKTRLAVEFARGTSGVATVLTGRFEPEMIVPFAPFIEVLRGLVRMTPAGELRRQLREVEGSDELVQLLPGLSQHLRGARTQVTATPEGRRFRMFDAFAEHLRRVARRRGVLVVIDDVQWADRGSLLLLRHVLRSTPDAAVLFVATYNREAIAGDGPAAELLGSLQREPAATRINLRGLQSHAVGELVAATSLDAPAWITAIVTSKSEGNPLFAVELTRHLVQMSGTHDTTMSERHDIPETIRDLLDRRLSHLSDATRRILLLASVVGREFDARLLQEIESLPEPELLGALDEAAAARVIVEDAQAGGHFSFSHPLIRDVCCGRITATHRMRLHHRIAEAIERQKERPRALGDLAYHFVEAAPLCDAGKAVAYAIRAGDEALAACAPEDAARYYEMAVRAFDYLIQETTQEVRRSDLHQKRGRAYLHASQWAAAHQAFETALSLLPPADDVSRGELLVNLAETSFWLMNVSDVHRFAVEASSLAERMGREDLAATALAWMASAKVSDGDVPGGVEIDRQALTLAGGVRSFGLARAPLTLYWAGRTTEAVERATDGVAFAKRVNDPAFLLYALQHLGLSLCGAGRYDESRQAFDEAIVVGRRSGALPLLARAISMSVALWVSLGDLETAAARAHDARALAHRVSFDPPIVSAGIDLLVIFVRQRDPDSAGKLLGDIDRAVQAARGWHAWKWEMRLAHARSELALAREDWAGAIHEATRAIERSQARGRQKYLALGLANRAAGLHRAGFTDAAANAEKAIGVARQLGDPAVLLRCLVTQLQIEGCAVASLVEARTTVQQMLATISDERLRQRFLRSVTSDAPSI
jgi:tetratricopeptide (TPR) repeat protein